MPTAQEEVQQKRRGRPPAKTPEARENQLKSLAYQLAEKQLRDGTASSQVITQMLRASPEKDRLELEILERQKELLVAKTEAIRASGRLEEVYKEALDAMRRYSGNQVVLDEI